MKEDVAYARLHLTLARCCLFFFLVLFLIGVMACRRHAGDMNLAAPASTAISPLPTVTPAALAGVELVGYLGDNQAQAVSVSGNYAYVSLGLELTILDISDPHQPKRQAELVLSAEAVDIAVAGSILYAATVADGLQIIDVSDPATPVVIGVDSADAFVNGVQVAGATAYVSGTGLRLLDVSTPETPVPMATYRVSGPDGPVGQIAAVSDNYVYTVYRGTNGTAGFRIIDVSDPSAPTQISNFDFVGSAVGDMAVVEETLYALVGLSEPVLQAVDISDPVRPVLISLETAEPWPGQNLAAAGQHLFLTSAAGSDSTGELQILDVGNRAKPVVVSRYRDLRLPAPDIEIIDEVAYVATGDGLLVVDLRDLAAPVAAATYTFDPVRSGKAVAVDGSMAYVAADEGGLLVVDVSDRAQPVVVGRYHSGGHAWDLDRDGRTVYLADEFNGLRLIDMTDPKNPTEVGAYDIPGNTEFFHGVAVAGNVAYVADGSIDRTGLRVIDVADPTAPKELAFLPLTVAEPQPLPPRVQAVAAAGTTVYVAAGTAGLRIIDVSDPAVPREIGFYDTAGRSSDVVVRGQHAYLADGDLHVIDVADPAEPNPVGFFDIPPDMASLPYVTVAGNYAYVNNQRDVWLLDVSDPGRPVVVDKQANPGLVDVAVGGDAIYAVGRGLYVFRPLLAEAGSLRETQSPQETLSLEISSLGNLTLPAVAAQIRQLLRSSFLADWSD